MITDTDKAWLAGVIDSRATFTVQLAKNMPDIILTPRVGEDMQLFEYAAWMMGMPDIKPWRAKDRSAWRYQCSEHCPEAHTHIIYGQRQGRLTLSGSRLLVVHQGVNAYTVTAILDKAAIQTWGSMTGYQDRVRRPLDALGWDTSCLDRLNGREKPTQPRSPRTPTICEEEGCEAPVHTGVLCGKHYTRKYRTKRRAADPTWKAGQKI